MSTTAEETVSTINNPPSIDGLTAALLPDGRRIRVTVAMQNTSSRPDLELILEDSRNRELGRSLLMGIFSNTAEFTLHIRDSDAVPPYTITAVLKAGEEQVFSQRSSQVT